MIYIRYTISKISFSYIMYITIILCRNYLQIVRSNYVYFGQINESVCLSYILNYCARYFTYIIVYILICNLKNAYKKVMVFVIFIS